jgi:DNA topoisomerase-3
MEGAGKLVDDDELREAMAGKGLGTPATRAAIIEGLLAEKYLVREGRELIPTAKAFQLMTLLRGLGVEELTQAELTGEWEHKLSQIERGRLKRDEFMREIAQMTQQIVKRAKEYDNDTIPGDYATLDTPCPQCGGQVKENYRRFACTACEFSISKIPGGRQFEIEEVEELLLKKEIGPLQGFRSKMGRPFAAILKLAKDDDGHWKMEFDFGQNDDEGDGEPVDFSEQTPVGQCPKCNGSVYEHGMKYVCENAVGSEKTCDFTTGKIILQQEISREQIGKLLTDGKTDLLTGFKSSRTGRNFKAFLVKQPDGKIGFEFEAREPKAGRAKPAAKPARRCGKSRQGGVGRAAKVAAKKAPAKKAARRRRQRRANEDGRQDGAASTQQDRRAKTALSIGSRRVMLPLRPPGGGRLAVLLLVLADVSPPAAGLPRAGSR